MREDGVEVLSLNRRPGLDTGTIRRFATALRTRRLDVLHAHQYTPFFYAATALRLTNSRTRMIFTEHGRHWPDVVSPKRRLVNRLLLGRMADRITAVCAFSARALARNDGFPASRIEVIENGIDADRYHRPKDRSLLRTRLGLAADRRYIATIARFHPVKDHHTLLRAFARVAGEVDDVDLLLVGDGPLRQALEALVTSLGLDQRVRFLGVRKDVPDVLAAVDLFALSSVSEAASITVLEAMATGTPVVVTDVGGNPEMVRNGVDGLLTPRGDAPAFADAVLRLLADPNLAASMASEGAERVRKTYRLDRTVDRYYEMYRQLSPASGPVS
jgi:N-acetyl-alpha-D-glucosaminyl L-malate synthase BshA